MSKLFGEISAKPSLRGSRLFSGVDLTMGIPKHSWALVEIKIILLFLSDLKRLCHTVSGNPNIRSPFLRYPNLVILLLVIEYLN